jgi:hypothetical protein
MIDDHPGKETMMDSKEIQDAVRERVHVDVPMILGPNGETWTLAQLSQWFGAEVRVEQPEAMSGVPFVAVVSELRVNEGPATQIVRVVNPDGQGLDRIAVIRWWQDAPQLPPWEPGCNASRWTERGVVGKTNDGGDVGFGMGGGDMPGTSAVWVANCDIRSGYVHGLGWKPGTNHAAIRVTFQVREAGAQPPPPPEPGDLGPVLERLDLILAAIPRRFAAE